MLSVDNTAIKYITIERGGNMKKYHAPAILRKIFIVQDLLALSGHEFEDIWSSEALVVRGELL